nr:MAG TPA: hypothetical protein [Caudoviricetes sp.]
MFVISRHKSLPSNRRHHCHKYYINIGAIQ